MRSTMKWRGTLVGVVAITVLYVIALVWIDSRKHVFAELPRLGSALWFVVALSFVSYVVRYARWHWLLSRAGHRTGVVRGLLAYLAGFAFTATPGKVGELVRIRYCTAQGVPSFVTLAAFVYERAFDLVAVLAIASLAVPRKDLLAGAVAFVAVFLAAIVVFARNASWLARLADALAARRLPALARLVGILEHGLVYGRAWMTAPDVAVSASLGLLAWAITSASFVWLLGRLGIVVPTLAAFAIYPLAQLVGAASMLPGGIGSTEVAIVALLALFDVPLERAALAAIGIRLASLWFAVLCGFVAIAVLEARPGPAGAIDDPPRPPR